MGIRERVDFWSGLWVATGLVIVVVAWINDGDRDFGFIVMVTGLVFSVEARLKREVQELRYRVGDLEYKNGQSDRSRGSQ